MSSPPPAPPRLLITGGRGRLASLLAEHFRARGSDVVLFSREPGPGFLPLETLTSPETRRGASALLHLAWSTLPATAEKAPDSAKQHDLPQLERLLTALARGPADARPHFIFFSSGGAVYGNAPGRASRETDACHPIGRYGAAKLAGESLVTHAALRDLPATILRISNPYGYAVPSGRAQGIIPHAIRCALSGEPLTLWGDGHARKDFLHAADFLGALDAVLTRLPSGVFNLAAGESHSVREIIALVEKHTGRPIATQPTPAAAWDVTDSRLDPAKFVAATGWRPQIALNEGIRRSVAAWRPERH